MDPKLQKLNNILRRMKKVVVAYSGGVDSTFLLYMAKAALGKDNVLAVTASSESYPASEKQLAGEIANRLSVKHKLIRTEELKNRNFKDNPVNRCYYCKKELFNKLNKIAKKEKFLFVLDGSNKDDLKDMRYGRIAAKEEKVRSPLQEAGFSKEDIRKHSKEAGLSTWKKPSFACLASRFAYDQKISKDRLKAIEEAEEFIKKLGFSQLRVRCHKDIVRIEVGRSEIKKFLKKDTRERIVKKLRSLGFLYITLDLMGYRTGSMNEGLKVMTNDKAQNLK